MIKADLKAAKISYVDNARRYTDFHSLRHSTGSLLAAAGVHPKVIQSIMRHSDINLTMSQYTHIFRGQESKAVEGLPDLSLPSREKQKAVATGTDNRPVDAVQNTPKELAPKWTPFLTPTAFSGCNRSATDGNERSNSQEKSKNDNCLKTEQLGIKKDNLALAVMGKKEKPTDGFEPSTPGLQNQSSTIELRWHILDTRYSISRFNCKSSRYRANRPIIYR